MDDFDIGCGLEGDNEYEQIVIKENIAFIEESEEEEEYFEHWIDKRSKDIEKMCEDIKYMSASTGICDTINAGYLGTFLEDMHYSHRRDTVEWDKITRSDMDEVAVVYGGKKNPTLKQWMAFLIWDLLDLYNYLRRNYFFKMKSFEEFSEFAYFFSQSKRLLPKFRN
jgi:hypothetical protein